MTEPLTHGTDAADEPPHLPLLRDPPPPPGYTNPVEESDVLEDPFTVEHEE